MITAEIVPDKLDNLRLVLDRMNVATGVVDPNNTVVPFAQLKSLHFARFVIIESTTIDDISAHGVSPRPWPPTLVFLGDIDGSRESFLAELCVRAWPGLIDIFSHCKNFKPDRTLLLNWLKEKNIRPSANYVNWVGRTVTQVREEAALHDALKLWLKRIESETESEPGPTRPEQVRLLLREFTEEAINRKELSLTRAPSTPVLWWIINLVHKVSVPILLLALTPLFLLALPLLGFRLRTLERSDPEIAPRPDPDLIAQLAGSEDQLVTNQFSAFGDVKPGLFRRYAITFFLFMLDYAARHVFNKGYLTRVQTIHFARWVLLEDKRRVLFASNYDGDLESYMDDFINKVGWGLNLVFSNGVGWPRTRWLIKGGAEYEQKFKYYLRRHQYHTNVWYKAYPDLTAVQLERNSMIRAGLFRDGFRNSDQLQGWLALI